MNGLDWRRYLVWMFGTMALVILTCGAMAYVVDPLGLFDSPRIDGLNAKKPYLDHHRELARWRAARRLCPNADIFGNSRAEIGFDPEHPAFAHAGLNAFNHAIPGTTLLTSARQLKWLREAGCAPVRIVLGVDFFDFLGGDPIRHPAPGADDMPRLDAAVIAETLFSTTALTDSIATVALQRARHPAITTPRGFNPLLNYDAEVEGSGHYTLFEQRAQENLKNWGRRPRRLSPAEGGQSEDEAALALFLAMATDSARTVDVAIYPYHAQMRLMLERAGLGSLFLEWKRRILAAAQRASTPQAQVRVWDFSGVSDATLEPIPAPGDRHTSLRFYWEAGHFKKALGDRMLDQMLSGQPGFGVELRREAIDSWLREDRQRVLDLLAGPPTALTRSVDALFRP